jgi:hypothetical protein
LDTTGSFGPTETTSIPLRVNAGRLPETRRASTAHGIEEFAAAILCVGIFLGLPVVGDGSTRTRDAVHGGAHRHARDIQAYGLKTTIEILDPLFRRAKSRAAERGQSLKELVTEALQEKLAGRTGTASSAETEWMEGFGKLRRLHRETERIQARIDDVFETVEPEDRA